VLIVCSSVLREGLLLILCTFLMEIVSRSIIGSMRGKPVILQDSMIIKGVDALQNSLQKNKRKRNNILHSILKI